MTVYDPPRYQGWVGDDYVVRFKCPPEVAWALMSDANAMVQAIKALGPERVTYRARKPHIDRRGQCHVCWDLDGRPATERRLIEAADPNPGRRAGDERGRSRTKAASAGGGGGQHR